VFLEYELKGASVRGGCVQFGFQVTPRRTQPSSEVCKAEVWGICSIDDIGLTGANFIDKKGIEKSGMLGRDYSRLPATSFKGTSTGLKILMHSCCHLGALLPI